MADQKTAKFRLTDGTLVDGVAQCSTDGPTVAPCLSLETLLTKEFERQSPRVRVMPMVGALHDRHRDAVVLDLGAKSLWPLAFCPFCGGAITTDFPPAPAAPEGGA